MAVSQWQSSRRRRSVAYLTLWLLVSIWAAATPTSDCQNAVPSQHGLMYEKNSGEASGAMMAFFDHPAAKPEALPLDVKDPMWRRPAAARAADPAGGSSSNGGHTHKTSASVIAGSTIAAGLIMLGVVAAAAYMVRARRTNRLRAAGSSQSLEEVRLGAAV
ncbi:uncharacterized protein M6B38_290765 [Iris pallida]|uniref:Uncharacterized protein n=1 Tax=Iris pallida TaxID=29817 RepID=A0AAX6HUY7_IRIPA|nr:uncharacterized protein M6B38_122210 [Iris pallida]KAJ6844886.1 uncharacterized protein M6B38_290765 [Iris pallida]